MKRILSKVLLLAIVFAMILVGSGLVQVDLHGSKKHIKGPVGSLVQQTVDYINTNMPWAKKVTLRVDKSQMEKDYIVDNGRKLQYTDEFSGFEHVVLVGTVEGSNQKLKITMDADYSMNSMAGIVLIGTNTHLARQAFGVKGNNVLTRNIDASTSGPFNLQSNTATWSNSPVTSNIRNSTGDGVVLQSSFNTQGDGAYNLVVTSGNSIHQQSTITLTGTPGEDDDHNKGDNHNEGDDHNKGDNRND